MDISNHNLDDIKDLLIKAEIDLAYLFGSVARGKAGPLSDIDIAVLFGNDVPENEHTARQGRLVSDLMLVLKRSEIDVAVLNRAAPLFKFLVVGEGRLIYSATNLVRIKFEVSARRDYFDTDKIRRMQNDALARRYERFAG